MTTATATRKPSKKMRRILMGIPGYDPFRDAKGCWFDEETANEALEFFPDHITHVTGPLRGEPYELQPHEQAITANLMGWKRDEDGMRRYSTCLYFVPRGNSKTTWAAGFVIMLAFVDRDTNAQMISTGYTRDQAALLYKALRPMVEIEGTELHEKCEVYQGAVIINGNPYKPIAAEAKSAHGENILLVVNDETHTHKDREFLDVVETGLGKKPQSLRIDITTSDYLREQSWCNETRDYAVQVRDGEVCDSEFLPAIFEVSSEELEANPDTWKDRKTWYRVNPMLGKAIPIRYFERMFRKALHTPAFENTFKRLHLNIRTENEEKLITAQMWNLGNGELDIAKYYGKQAAGGGLDLGSTSDLCSLCLEFEREDGEIDAFWWHWAPRVKATERQKKHNAPYLQWAREGWLTLTDDSETDYGFIRKDINDIADKIGIPDLAVDRKFQGAQLCQDLKRDGFEITDFGQGFYSMTAPTLDFIHVINRGEYHHGDNPLMRWQAGNVMAKLDAAGNIKPDKAASGNKIDGIVAAIMARAQAMGREKKVSVYEEEGKELVVL